MWVYIKYIYIQSINQNEKINKLVKYYVSKLDFNIISGIYISILKLFIYSWNLIFSRWFLTHKGEVNSSWHRIEVALISVRLLFCVIDTFVSQKRLSSVILLGFLAFFIGLLKGVFFCVWCLEPSTNAVTSRACRTNSKVLKYFDVSSTIIRTSSGEVVGWWTWLWKQQQERISSNWGVCW